MRLGNKAARRRDDPRLFSRRHGRQRSAEVVAGAKFDFDKGKDVSLPGDDVDLTESAAPIASDDPVPPLSENPAGCVFAHTSQDFFDCVIVHDHEGSDPTVPHRRFYSEPPMLRQTDASPILPSNHGRPPNLLKMGTVLRDVRTIAHQDLPIDIRIDGKYITAISPSPMVPKDGDDILDGAGKLAIPGLVNAHGHAPMTLLRGIADDVPLQTWLEQAIWPAEAKLTEDDIYWGTLLAQVEMLQSGTTQFVDMYFHVEAIARAVAEGGLRALLSYGMIADRLDQHGRQEIDRTEHLLHALHGEANDRIRMAVAPHAIYTCGEEIWRRAVALANQYNVAIHTHVCETKKEVDDWRSSHGRTPVAELERLGVFSVPTLAAHCVHVDLEDIDRLAGGHVTVIHCPASNAKLGSGIAPLDLLFRHDIPVAIGTDGAASNNNLDMLRELRLAVLLQKASRQDPTALNAEDAFKLATLNGAAACGTNAGALGVGTLADLVLIDLERCPTMPVHRPLSSVVYASDPASVTDVFVDGRPLLRNGELLTLDEEKIRAEARRIGSRLVG